MSEIMNKQEQLINIATKSIADRLTMEDTLQDRVVNLDVVYDSVGVTFLNKDGSFFIEVWEWSKEDNCIIYSNSVMSGVIKELLTV